MKKSKLSTVKMLKSAYPHHLLEWSGTIEKVTSLQENKS